MIKLYSRTITLSPKILKSWNLRSSYIFCQVLVEVESACPRSISRFIYILLRCVAFLIVLAILLQIKPLSVRYGLGISDHDSEGRLVTAEFDSFYVIYALSELFGSPVFM